jgi:hypothetical protein
MSFATMVNFADGAGGGGREGDEIRRRCGSSVDDGFSIACDAYGRRRHAAYFALESTLQHAQGHAPFVFGSPPPPHLTLLHPCASSSSSTYGL